MGMNLNTQTTDRYRILDDFNHILDFIDFIEKNGETRIAFYEL